jgi:hypothetical protein
MRQPRLTSAQSQALLAIVDYQRVRGREITFNHYQDRIHASGAASAGSSAAPQASIADVSQMVFAVWRERGYVVPIESADVHGTTVRDFVLTQEALDYAERMRKPRLVRGCLDMLDDWKSDLRTAVLATVFTILTNVVLNLLGLLR